ncbi:hypothetical protein C8R44DRAFT_739002 [Mycena epipterygia]|nr:hypothetical protein C8R44DRAFT_739002 [Mycena epipterygia]
MTMDGIRGRWHGEFGSPMGSQITWDPELESISGGRDCEYAADVGCRCGTYSAPGWVHQYALRNLDPWLMFQGSYGTVVDRLDYGPPRFGCGVFAWKSVDMFSDSQKRNGVARRLRLAAWMRKDAGVALFLESRQMNGDLCPLGGAAKMAHRCVEGYGICGGRPTKELLKDIFVLNQR